MQKRSLNRSGVVDADQYYTPRPGAARRIESPLAMKTRSLASLMIGAAISLTALVAMVSLMVSNWSLYIHSMSLLLQLIVWALVIGIPLAAISILIKFAYRGVLNVAHEVTGLADQRAEQKRLNALNAAEVARIHAEAQRINAEAMARMRTIDFDQYGNAAVIGVDPASIAQLRGQYPTPRIAGAPADEQKLLNEANERIPEVVRYEDIAREVPDGMSLLGIHPTDGTLELTAYDKLKCLWIVGSSSTGKSNTVSGKVGEAVEQGARLLVIDQHAAKEDSLARKLQPYQRAFLRPVAVTDQEVLDTLAFYKQEFEARVKGASCEQKIVLIADEMNRMNRNDDLKKALKEIVFISGEEARGFGMYGWFISQKATGLKWLRDSAITVIVHKLTRFEEALLACNEDRNAAKELLKFKIGRTFVYGVDFDEPMVLQQPLYKVVEGSVSVIDEVPTSETTSIDEVIDENRVVYFNPLQKQREVENTANSSHAQEEIVDDPRIGSVALMMLEGKSVNQILREIWGISAPGGAYQAALTELREVQKVIAKRAVNG